MKRTLQILLFFLTFFHVFRSLAQSEDDNPPPSEPPVELPAGATLGGDAAIYDKGVLGKLINPIYFPLLGETYFYGTVPFTGISYFPYLNKHEENLGPDFTEHLGPDQVFPLPVPGTTPYTTAFALGFLKHPIGLAGIEVVGLHMPGFGEANKFYSFASLYTPQNNGYDPDFTDLAYDQHHPPADYQHPFKGWGKYAVSCLEAAESFTKFAAIHLGWLGFDKLGQKVITIVLQGGPGSQSKNTHYSSLHNAIFMKPAVEYEKDDPNYGKFTNYDHAAREIVGHEIAHAIIKEVQGDLIWAPDNKQPTEMREMAESFCDIMGTSSMNYYNATGFASPKWVYGHNLADPDPYVTRSFNNPKNYFIINPPTPGFWPFIHPTTYKGKFYVDLADPEWYEHHNSTVMSHWFYLLVKGKTGKIDDDPLNESYDVKPIDPANPSSSWMKALKIIFGVFTEQTLTYQTTYAKMRENTLFEAVKQGYPIGSYEYIQIANAWHAVGVGEKMDFNQDNNLACAQGLTTAGETAYYGQQSFNSNQYSMTPDPASPKFNKLQECASNAYPAITTRRFDYKSIIDINGDGKYLDEFALNAGGQYEIQNDLSKSKAAVGVHWGTEYSLSWFNSMFGVYGIDAAGSEIQNIIEEPGGDIINPVFSAENKKFYHGYGYGVPRNSLDYIGKVLTEAMYFYRWGKIERNADGTSKYPESETVRGSVSDIIGLSLYNHFRLSNNQEATWTFGNDPYAGESTPYARSFEDPKANWRFHPNYYKGVYYQNDPNYENSFAEKYAPDHNNGVLNFWYYLLVNGTGQDANGKTNEAGQQYFVNGIGLDQAVRLVWRAFNEHLKPHPTVEDFKIAVYDAIVSLGLENEVRVAAHDAFFAVGLEKKKYQDLLHISPAYGEIVTDCWPVEFRVEVKYPLYESNRVFEVSEDKTFSGQQAPVYRFLNYASPDLSNSSSLGRYKLERGKEYWFRSRLVVLPNQSECQSGLTDPQICAQLRNKYDWTEPSKFFTSVAPPTNHNPTQGTVAPAWDTPFSWDQVKGAEGYITKIEDGKGIVPMQEQKENIPYLGDETQIVKHLALAKENKYSWTLAAWTRIGSTEAVKHSGSTTPDDYTPLTEDEKKMLFIDTQSEFTDQTEFSTDLPGITLQSPANNTEVSMIGSLTTSASANDIHADHFKWTFFYDGDSKDPKRIEEHQNPSVTIFKIQNLPFLEDKHVYGWTFTPVKDAVLPFIPEREEGATPAPFHFVVKKDKIPVPVVMPTECKPMGQDVVLKWEAVPGAKGYEYTIKNVTTSETKTGVTQDLETPPISGITDINGNYTWSIKAGVKKLDGEGNQIDWVFGPGAGSSYLVRPPATVIIEPAEGSTVNYLSEDDKSVRFTWEKISGVTNYNFALFQGNIGNNLIKQQLGDVSQFEASGLEDEQQFMWSIAALNPINPKVCGQGTLHGFTTPKLEVKPINSDLAFTLDKFSSDDFDIIVKTPSGYVFTYSDDQHYVQDTQDDEGPDIAFFTNPEEGEYELSVRIFAVNANKCPATFTLKALENGEVKEILGNNIQVICLYYFPGAEIGQIVNGQATTFKYKYHK